MASFVVYIDTSALSYPLFLIQPAPPGGPIRPVQDGSNPTDRAVELTPGTYNYQHYSGYYADFTFTVTDTGAIVIADEFRQEFGGFLKVSTTTTADDTLIVNGYPIEIDGTALSHGLRPMMFGEHHPFLPSDRVHTLILVPASNYQVQPANAPSPFRFQVTGPGGGERPGQVVIPSEFTGYPFYRAAGNRLTLLGYTITVDNSELSHDLLPIRMNGNVSRLVPANNHRLTLFPAPYYGFLAGSGTVADLVFTVDINGAVLLASEYQFPYVETDGRVITTGGNRVWVDSVLRVKGYRVLIDATDADSALIGLIDVNVPATTPQYLIATMVPADYRLQTANGVFTTLFTLTRENQITVPAASSFQVSMTPTLQIIGPTPF